LGTWIGFCVWVSVIERILIWSDAIKALRALNLDLRPSTFTVAMFKVLGEGVELGPPPGAATLRQNWEVYYT
jgi:hypothetical protein